jgi:hypothetical protein
MTSYCPNFETAVDTIINPQLPGDELAEEQIPELLEKVRRASAIAGPVERKAAHNLWSLWVEQASQKKTPTPYTSPVYRLRDELSLRQANGVIHEAAAYRVVG